MTARHSRERQDLEMNASNARKHFLATGGDHINSDDFFNAHTRAEQTDTIRKREKEKKRRIDLVKLESEVRNIIDTSNVREQGVCLLTVALLKPLVLWKLKVKAEKGKKADLVQQWSSLPEPEPAPVCIEQDEIDLQMLQHQ